MKSRYEITLTRCGDMTIVLSGNYESPDELDKIADKYIEKWLADAKGEVRKIQ